MREKWEAQARDYVEVRSTLEAQLADKQRLDQLERTRRDELRKADEDKWAVMASVKSLERQLHNTQQLQQAVDDENQQLHQQIERLKQEARQAQQQLEQAEASRDELSRQQTTHEAERRLYDERLAGLSDQLQIRKQASSVLQDELTALQRQLDDCKEHVARLEDEAAHYGQIETDLVRLRTDNQLQSERVRSLEADGGGLRSKLAELHSERHDAIVQYETLKQKFSALKRDLGAEVS
eukprot:TRINITY_DN4135_c0_g2_i1.p2 TRINITY_DN4135_c0_g2~~TRINITY_DN4135_c0_g2_i1.p2  ORF type:complete len:238 (-),score=118.24 TRINITY_DN4135_c0_g2_i1:146-859(-)